MQLLLEHDSLFSSGLTDVTTEEGEKSRSALEGLLSCPCWQCSWLWCAQLCTYSAQVHALTSGEHITDSSTTEEAVAVATELLQRERSDGVAVELESLKRSISLFSNAAKDSTVVVLGLGLQVYSLAKVRA